MKPSDETRRKISEGQKGKKLSEEHRKKLSEAAKNISEETRRKTSEAAKNRVLKWKVRSNINLQEI